MRYHIKLKLWGSGENRKFEIPEHLRPVLGYDETMITTDSDGWGISPGIDIKDKGIYMLGDSWIENSYINSGSRLTDIINNILDGHSYGYYMYNGGMSGSSIINMYNIYVNLLMPKQSPIVMVFLGRITEFCAYMENTYWNNTERYGPFTIDRTGGKACDERVIHFSELDRLLTLFHYSTILNNHRFILATVPSLTPSENRLAYNRHIVDFSINNRLDCLDLASLNLQEYGVNIENLFFDKYHCNAEGCALYGTYIACWLIKKRILLSTHSQ